MPRVGHPTIFIPHKGYKDQAAGSSRHADRQRHARALPVWPCTVQTISIPPRAAGGGEGHVNRLGRALAGSSSTGIMAIATASNDAMSIWPMFDIAGTIMNSCGSTPLLVTVNR